MKAEFAGEMTQCHKALHKLLKEMGFQVRDNTEYDQYRIDCTIDEIPSVGFEADGKLYHSWKRDRERDQYLLHKFSIRVLRIPERLLLDKNMHSDVKEMIGDFLDDKN